jgi:putative flavoprotein involved in K+ transport
VPTTTTAPPPAGWRSFLQGRSGPDLEVRRRTVRRGAARRGTAASGQLDTVIVGAGAAGLALGHHLRRAGRRFVILEADERVGASWRRRRDSVTPCAPRRADALPGMPFPGHPRGFTGEDEVADYLEAYARRFHLPVELGSPVVSVRHDLSDGFAVETGRLELSARQVVVATGSRSRHPWLHLPVLDADGSPVHERGLTQIPGLAFLGLPGQRTPCSGLREVGRDAAVLAEALGRHLAGAWPAQGAERPARVST